MYQGGVSSPSVHPVPPLPLGSTAFTVYMELYVPFYCRQLQNVKLFLHCSSLWSYSNTNIIIIQDRNKFGSWAKMEFHKVWSLLFCIKSGNSSKPSGLLQRLKQSLHKCVRQNKRALCACRPPGKGVSQCSAYWKVQFFLFTKDNDLQMILLSSKMCKLASNQTSINHIN